MGIITVKLSDETEDSVREALWNHFRGKGKTLGKFLDVACQIALEKMAEDKAFADVFWAKVANL